MIMKCKNNCASCYQDKKYGKGMRLFNVLPSKGNLKRARCTVCLKEQVVKNAGIEVADRPVTGN